MEKELLFELEVVKERLNDDIQALTYIQEDLVENEKRSLDVQFIKNNIETLLKSMLYNKTNIKEAIKKAGASNAI